MKRLLSARIWALLVPALCISALLGGCASVDGFPEPVVEPSVDLEQVKLFFANDVLNNYANLSGEVARRSYRDQVAYGRLRGFDVRYQQFLRALSREAGTTNIAADLLALTLNGLGATTGDAATKAALAAASGGILGAQGAVNKDLFYQKTLPALLAQMDAGRKQARAVLEAGLASSDAVYSLHKALVDLDAYQVAGSLPGAFNAIVQDAGTKTAAAEREIRISRDASFTTALGPAVAIGEQISALTDAQALKLANAMEPILKQRPQNLQDIIARSDPDGMRLKNGASAKLILRQWSILDQRDSASQKQWTDAIAAAKG